MTLTLLLLLACTDKEDDTGTPPVDDTGETADTGGIDTATCEDMDGDLGDPEAPGCAAAGGVCAASLDACEPGTRLPDHDAECVFDDGTGYCCAPPAASASGDSCAEQGGLCAPISGCDYVKGWFTPTEECGELYGIPSVCCAPQDSCEGYGVITCCTDDEMAAYRASCLDGEAVCTVDGTSLMCDQDCAAYDI